MVRVKAGHLDLANPVLGLARHLDKITIRQRGAVTEGQRIGFDATGNRPPDIDDRKPPGQQLIRLVRQNLAKAFFRRPGRVVIMDHRGWLTHRLRAAKAWRRGPAGMVENLYPRRAGDIPDQRCCLGIIGGGQRRIIAEIIKLAVMRHQGKSGTIQIKGPATPVIDDHLAMIIVAIMFGDGAAGL